MGIINTMRGSAKLINYCLYEKILLINNFLGIITPIDELVIADFLVCQNYNYFLNLKIRTNSMISEVLFLLFFCFREIGIKTKMQITNF